MCTQERQFYIALLFNMCRHWRTLNGGLRANMPNDGNDHLMAAIDHVAFALHNPAFEIVR